jgi:putative tryptophan/tyrosine transport system substrate-binding protein
MNGKSALWLTLPILLAAVATANAQQSAKKIPLIGILELATPAASASQFKAFQQGLRELGYAEGKNIIVEYRYADGKLDRLPQLAAELVRAKVDVIVTRSTGSIRAAMKASRTIPIVFPSAGAPVEDGLIASLGKPGGNVTGLTQLSAELDGKKLEILKQSAPKITQVGLLWTVGSARSDNRSRDAEPAAKALGIHLESLELKDSDDFARIFNLAKQLGVQALSLAPSPLLFTHRATIFDFLAKNRLPAMYSTRDFVEAGGLMSYGQDLMDNWRRAATFVDKILKGANPGDLPVEQAKTFEFIINLKAAKQIGLTIPQTVLAGADKIIK